MTDRVERILENVTGRRILHVGCAGSLQTESDSWLHGRLMLRFPESEIVGLELDGELVERMRALGYENVVQGNAESMSFERDFDCIVAGEVIEHLSNPGQFLQASIRALKPGGRLVVTTPYIFGLFHFAHALLRFPKTSPNPEHSCWFCPSTLSELAHREGLKVERFELAASYPLDMPGCRIYLFSLFMHSLGRLLPKRLRSNRMLFVLSAP